MAIQIIDNFSLNANKPIDSRFVVGGGNFYATRNAIPSDRRYIGLRIWDLDNVPPGPYVWDGSDWINENTLGISGNGTANYVSKFTSSNVIANSQIFDNGTSVGIGTITPTNKLSVNGDVSATGFIGNGSQLIALNINSSNVTGEIGLNNLPNGTNGHILQSSGTSTQWVAQNTLSVGNATNATNATNVNIQSTTTDNNNHYVLFSTATGNQPIRTRNTNQSIRINPSTGNIGINTSTMNNKLTISGNVSIGSTTTAPTNGLRVDGITQTGGLYIGHSLSNLYHTFVTAGSVDIRDGIFMNVGFNSGDWRRSTSNPGLALFYQTFGNENKWILYVNNSGAAANPTTINAVFKIDPAPSNPTFEVINKITIGNVSGTGTATALFRNNSTGEIQTSSSDIRLKENISEIEDSLNKVKNLRGVYFTWKNDDSRDKHIGLIAQEVESVFPEAVQFNGVEDYKTVRYSELTSLLINAIKEQQEIIEDLKKRVEDLES
jgi:trimeric autotransporter adhesin